MRELESSWETVRVNETMTKLANFKPAEMPIKMELGQLGQLFFDGCDDGSVSVGGPRRLDRTLRRQKTARDGTSPSRGKRPERTKLARLANFKPAKMPVKMEVGQLCQLFFDGYDDGSVSVGGPRRLIRTLRRQTTARDGISPSRG